MARGPARGRGLEAEGEREGGDGRDEFGGEGAAALARARVGPFGNLVLGRNSKAELFPGVFQAFRPQIPLSEAVAEENLVVDHAPAANHGGAEPVKKLTSPLAVFRASYEVLGFEIGEEIWRLVGVVGVGVELLGEGRPGPEALGLVRVPDRPGRVPPPVHAPRVTHQHQVVVLVPLPALPGALPAADAGVVPRSAVVPVAEPRREGGPAGPIHVGQKLGGGDRAAAHLAQRPQTAAAFFPLDTAEPPRALALARRPHQRSLFKVAVGSPRCRSDEAGLGDAREGRDERGWLGEARQVDQRREHVHELKKGRGAPPTTRRLKSRRPGLPGGRERERW
mmetsp:Transcript_39726/g.88936  ORF Transcript_39726/g.88936 Transcript_39726/m.88936 type:complete len:337 (-) Transcript_39726:1776-2786(-)